MRESRKASFAFALHDSGQGLSTYHGVRKYGIELEVLASHRPEIASACFIAGLQQPGALRLADAHHLPAEAGSYSGASH